MSYQKQNFANGEVLTASQLNHIEDGIVDVESTANETKGVVDKIIDPTLSLSGKAADAKATGDKIGQLKEDLSDAQNAIFGKTNFTKYRYLDNLGNIVFDDASCISTKIYGAKKGVPISVYAGEWDDQDKTHNIGVYDSFGNHVDNFNAVNGVKRTITINTDFDYLIISFAVGCNAYVCDTQTGEMLWRAEVSDSISSDVGELKTDVGELKTDVGVLKGTPNYVRGFKLLRDGSRVTADGLCVSDSIAVTSGNNVTVTAGEYQAENLIFVFYDANGAFVDYFGMVNMESRIMDIPQNATSLKVTFVDGYSARVYDNGTMNNLWEVGFNSGVFYEIDQLRNEIRGTEYLPKYYFSDNYITSKVNEINSIIKSCASNGDAFFFITDEHWELNARNSPMLVKYLHDKCNITRLFDGGDRYNGYDEYRVDCLLREAMGSDRVYPVVGNHEYLLGGTNNDAFATSFIHITDAVWGEQGKPYYFVDNKQQKIRYIMLQAFDEHHDGSVGASIGYSDAELAWLQNTALNVEHGWVIIIFTHSMLVMNDNTKTVGVPSGRFKMAYDIINNYDGEGTIACVIMGHAHWDKKHTTSSGVQMIVTTCDKYDLSREPGLEQDTRTPGTISEQAFEVVVLDKQNRKITFVRIGNPINDIDEPDTQKRVITY